ncbi:hypothetical protein BDY21DRAFT_193720 [Lineolata rhizophorae]|uniref:Uncharacterized protein n=1 Tax=Lineolata rhizophorae TaxID=578093 RepID=A0A6A6P717_9PEZI|nr:hypothetical protein BDY21DRAFT_193720 [Lineolata rhizophorae]
MRWVAKEEQASESSSFPRPSEAKTKLGTSVNAGVLQLSRGERTSEEKKRGQKVLWKRKNFLSPSAEDPAGWPVKLVGRLARCRAPARRPWTVRTWRVPLTSYVRSSTVAEWMNGRIGMMPVRCWGDEDRSGRAGVCMCARARRAGRQVGWPVKWRGGPRLGRVVRVDRLGFRR